MVRTDQKRGDVRPADQDSREEVVVDQLAICTREPGCVAPPDAHEPDCPVEAKLREDFGF